MATTAAAAIAVAAASVMALALVQMTAAASTASGASSSPTQGAPADGQCGKPLTGIPRCPLWRLDGTNLSSAHLPVESADPSTIGAPALPLPENCWIIVALAVPNGCGRLAYATLRALLDSHFPKGYITLQDPSPAHIAEAASKYGRVLVDLSFYPSLYDYLDVFQHTTMIFELRSAAKIDSKMHSGAKQKHDDDGAFTGPSHLEIGGLVRQCNFSHYVVDENDLLDEHRRYGQILDMAAALNIKVQNSSDLENPSIVAQIRRRVALEANHVESEDDPPLLSCLSPQSRGNPSPSVQDSAAAKGVHIITTVFGEHAPHRLIELIIALYKNIVLPQVADITVMAEKITSGEVFDLMGCVADAHYQESQHTARCKRYKIGYFLRRGLKSVRKPGSRSQLEDIFRKKLFVVETSTQPTYAHYLQYANTHFLNQMVIITNSDIYFDVSLGCVLNGYEEMKRENLFLALTRAPAFECPGYVFSSRKVQSYFDSSVPNLPGFEETEPFLCGFRNSTADSFIFVPTEFSKAYGVAKNWMTKAGIYQHPTGRPGQLYLETLNLAFPQNRFGAENAFSQVMHDSYGYTVLNGCRRIAARHLHCTFDRENVTTSSVGPQGIETFRLDGFEYPEWLETCVKTTVKWTMWGQQTHIRDYTQSTKLITYRFIH